MARPMTDIPPSIPDRKNSYDYVDLIKSGHGQLFGPENGRLPLPPMLMLDRITHISAEGGAYDKGELRAELDIRPDLWFFDCHFEGDPVMPGCLGLDALWQLVGFFLTWSGAPGSGRALGAKEIKFSGQVMPQVKNVRYEIHVRRMMRARLILGIADGYVFADDTQIYEAKDLRVGLFSREALQGGAL